MGSFQVAVTPEGKPVSETTDAKTDVIVDFEDGHQCRFVANVERVRNDGSRQGSGDRASRDQAENARR